MKIFITGGTGFIGQHTVRRLHHDGHDLLLLVRKKGDADDFFFGLDRISCIEGDLGNIVMQKERIASFAPDVLVHLAWQGIPDYSIENCRKNLMMSIDLFSVISGLGCKICITTGSCWEYGRGYGELREDMGLIEKSVFCSTKTAVHRIGMQIARERGMRFVWLRLFYVYGLGQRSGSVIPSILRAIRANESPAIRNPQNKNDFVYVEDVADAISKAIQEDVQGAFNIGSGYATSLNTIMEIAANALGNNLSKDGEDGIIMDNKADALDFWADISKARRELRWVPHTTMAEGIHRMIQAGVQG